MSASRNIRIAQYPHRAMSASRNARIAQCPHHALD
jgi:hypothetical protein